MKLSRERQEWYRQRYAEMRPSWQPSTHVYEALVAGRLGTEVRVLDLGCGRGGVVERLHRQADFVAGVDPDWQSLLEHRESSLDLACGLAEALPYSDRAFDLVCCSWVLEHLREPDRVFCETARVLRGGGRFVFLTPNSRHPLLMLNRVLAWTQGRLVDYVYDRGEPDIFPAWYRANSMARIEQLARQAGMRRISLQPIGDPSYLAFNEPLFRLACLAERVTPQSMHVHLVAEYEAL